MEAPARLSSAVVGLAGGLLRTGYRHSAAHDRSQLTRPVDQDFCWLCADYRLRAGRFRSFDEPVGNGGGDGCIEEDVGEHFFCELSGRNDLLSAQLDVPAGIHALPARLAADFR